MYSNVFPIGSREMGENMNKSHYDDETNLESSYSESYSIFPNLISIRVMLARSFCGRRHTRNIRFAEILTHNGEVIFPR